VGLGCDEKSQVQALGLAAPVLPMQPHLIERRSHDYIRGGYRFVRDLTTAIRAFIDGWNDRRRPGAQGRAASPAPG
jgi:hypothetical protein